MESVQQEVRQRFGLVPNFFRLAPDNPEITANLWAFARFGYLDNPLPSLFKERLFVWLSRFCQVRYCIARHVGFLLGMGRAAGDPSCAPETIEDILHLLTRAVPRAKSVQAHIERCKALDGALAQLPQPDSELEWSIFACATQVFLKTAAETSCLQALQHALGPSRMEHLLVLLAFVRTAHYWTEVHPELRLEDDMQQLLSTHQQLCQCLLEDPEACASEIGQRLLEENASLRRENQQLTRESEAADRSKDEFLATLAHELRNPLAPISNAVRLLQHPKGRRQADRLVELIDRQVHQIVHLVDDLLEVSRISGGKVELNKAAVPLAEVVNAAIETSGPCIEQGQHHLSVVLPQEGITLNADSLRLTQVLTNLLNNAAKYTPHGGEISLAARREGDSVSITVQDNGIGIPPDQLVRIFDIFTQAHPGDGGLGVGLSMVRSLVELHGGTVQARSGGAGQGSQFTVCLPLPPSRPGAGSAPGAAPGAGFLDGQRVLVVDDNRDAADTLALLLQAEGAAVKAVYNGRDALDALPAFQPTAVLLDLGMPGMDGYAVARELRRDPQNRSLRIAALTGWGQDADRRRTHEGGFDAHLTKPVDIDALNAWLTGT